MSSIGVDVGTSMVKAVRFGPDGTAHQSASIPVVVSRPRPGWAEQDMDEVAAYVAQVVREVAPTDGVVDVLAVTAQGDGCWLVDAAGRPVRPAMLWSDARASDVVTRWQRGGLLDEVFASSGSYGNSGLATAALHWQAEHEPDTLSRASTLLSCASWVHLSLTGDRVWHVSDACNPFLDARPYDVVAAALGLGAVREGSGFGILGTTLCVGAVTTDPMLTRTPSGMTLRPGWPGRWLLAYATLAGTEVLEWARRMLGCESAAALVQLAGTSRSSSPPLVLPYLSPAGERAPFRDPAVRGAILGLSLEHESADLALGVLHGLSLTVRDCLVASGQHPESLALCGGGARSDAWCKLLADATRTPVSRAEHPEVGASGAVLAALVALGAYAGVDAAAATVTRGPLLVPDPVAAQRLDAEYARFLAARRDGAPYA